MLSASFEKKKCIYPEGRLWTCPFFLPIFQIRFFSQEEHVMNRTSFCFISGWTYQVHMASSSLEIFSWNNLLWSDLNIGFPFSLSVLQIRWFSEEENIMYMASFCFISRWTYQLRMASSSMEIYWWKNLLGSNLNIEAHFLLSGLQLRGFSEEELVMYIVSSCFISGWTCQVHMTSFSITNVL